MRACLKKRRVVPQVTNAMLARLSTGNTTKLEDIVLAMMAGGTVC